MRICLMPPLLVLAAAGLQAESLPPSPSGPAAAALVELRVWLAQPVAQRARLAEQPFAARPLDRHEAARAAEALWADHLEELRRTRAAEMKAKCITLEGRELRFEWRLFGSPTHPPAGGRSLYLSLHGGGGAPKRVNDSQWTNQIRLAEAYRPAEGIYVAPRAPTDNWNLWHEAHMDALFARLIENFVALHDVNPNRVYLMGYSAGGDGVYQLAPRTPDRWAAAAMMAGHPNEASPLGLRNVPFTLYVGARDAAFRRNEVAAEWGRRLAALRAEDPEGYRHEVNLIPGKGHWMDLADRQAVPWMAGFTRNPLPQRVVWFQDDVVHPRCYWLERPPEELRAGQLLIAQRAGQTITLTATNRATVTVRLNDRMLNLDEPVVVRADSQVLFSNRVQRTIGALAETLARRGDPDLMFPASVTVTLPGSSTPAPAEN